jgi:PAS domain S-box-containing protein
MRLSHRTLDLAMICDAHWDVVFNQIGLGFWELSLPTGILRSSTSFKKNFGYPADGVLTYETILGLILPEDLDRVQDDIELTISNEQRIYHSVYRIRRPDGEIRWIRADGIMSQPNDESLKLVGTTIDVTDEKITST